MMHSPVIRCFPYEWAVACQERWTPEAKLRLDVPSATSVLGDKAQKRSPIQSGFPYLAWMSETTTPSPPPLYATGANEWQLHSLSRDNVPVAVDVLAREKFTKSSTGIRKSYYIKSVVGQSCLHSGEAVVKQQTSTWNTISENKWNCKSFKCRCKSGLRSNRHVRETLTAYCIDSVHGISADPRDSNIRMRYIFQYLQHRPARYHRHTFQLCL